MKTETIHTSTLLSSSTALTSGAHNQNRTGDLFLTKEVLYRLSYVGPLATRF